MCLKPFSDIHSRANVATVQVRHIDLDLVLDMASRTLSGTASLTVYATGSRLILDTQDLAIASVTCPTGPLAYTLMPSDPILGSALVIALPCPGTHRVAISYSTSPTAPALQWLSAMEACSTKPFMFSQGEAILTRSIIPCQDTPSIKQTWSARLRSTTPQTMLMSGRRHPSSGPTCVYYGSTHPVPSYLIAMAAGDLEFRATGPRTGVWALPDMVNSAAWEFSDMEAMLTAAETLYGPYDWGRFDALVMPKSFPMGGMENPCLTFVTPTLLTGDKSLVCVVAHELAHAWSGNKVTNNNWSDLWLNEGLTVYAEHRILEVLYGPDIAQLHRAVDGQTLAENLAELSPTPTDTHLCIPLDNRDPDEAFSYIPYHKGASIWRRMEEILTRPRFDELLRQYIDTFAWQSISHLDWVDFWQCHMTCQEWDMLDAQAWLHGPGIPDSQPLATAFPSSHMLAAAVAQVPLALANPAHLFATGLATAWTPYQWVALIKSIPLSTTPQQYQAMDNIFALSRSANLEIAFNYCHRALKSGDIEAWYPAMRIVSLTGRHKMVKPIYDAMLALDRHAARALYSSLRETYHSTLRRVLDRMLLP